MNLNLNKNYMINYVKKLLNIYNSEIQNQKDYIGFTIYSDNLNILIEEGNKAKNIIKYIRNEYNKFQINTLKMIIYSYILIPLVCSFKLSINYLNKFKEIADSLNTDQIINFLNSINI